MGTSAVEPVAGCAAALVATRGLLPEPGCGRPGSGVGDPGAPAEAPARIAICSRQTTGRGNCTEIQGTGYPAEHSNRSPEGSATVSSGPAHFPANLLGRPETAGLTRYARSTRCARYGIRGNRDEPPDT